MTHFEANTNYPIERSLLVYINIGIIIIFVRVVERFCASAPGPRFYIEYWGMKYTAKVYYGIHS